MAAVDHRDRERRRVHAVLALGGEVGEHERARQAARARAEQVDVVAAGDVGDDVERAQLGLDVVVDAPGAVLARRVAPHHREELHALADEVLDEAPARGQVEEVVLVDLRRDHQQRPDAHPLGRRAVLQDLADLVAVDHRAGWRRGSRRPGRARRRPARACRRCARRRARRCARRAATLSAGGVERPLERRRVARAGCWSGRRTRSAASACSGPARVATPVRLHRRRRPPAGPWPRSHDEVALCRRGDRPGSRATPGPRSACRARAARRCPCPPPPRPAGPWSAAIRAAAGAGSPSSACRPAGAAGRCRRATPPARSPRRPPPRRRRDRHRGPRGRDARRGR